MRLLIDHPLKFTVTSNTGISEEDLDQFIYINEVLESLSVQRYFKLTESEVTIEIYQQKVDLGESWMNRLFDEVLNELFKDINIQYVPRGTGCEMTLRISVVVPRYC